MQYTTLSTADVARLFNVTETTVKRWADDGTLQCQKTPGGHRKFIIRYVVEFAEKNNIEPSGVLSIPDNDGLGPSIRLAVLERNFPALVHAFIEKALSPDPHDLFQYFSYLYEHKFHLWEIYDLILRPGMVEIGERWKRKELGVESEHRASYETLDALAKLQAEIRRKPSNGKLALFACIGEEQHEIGLRCASYLFQSEGWETHYLGARTPASAVLAAIREHPPEILCISMSCCATDRASATQFKEVIVAAKKWGATVIGGGQGAGSNPACARLLDAICSSSRELLGVINA